MKYLQSMSSFGYAALLLAVGACGSGDEQAGGARGGRQWGGGGGFGGAGMAAAVPVKVETAEYGDISNYILKNVAIEAERWVDVRSRTSGQVVAIEKEEGDPIRQGDVLARLDADAARLQMEQMEFAYEEALRKLKRVEEMFEKNLISKEEAEAARTTHDRSNAQYEQAKLNHAYTQITAPIEGIVTIRSVEIGNMVTNNQVVFSVADFDPLLAKIRVTEREFGNIRLEQKARITVESNPGVEFEGKVTMISPVVDPESGTIKVTIEIPRQKGGALRPGMFASVYIITETHEQAVVIPKKSLVLEGEGNQVFVYEPDSTGAGKAVRRKVEVGFTDTDRLEVVSGLRAGEQIITVGQEGLRPGTAVRIVGEAPVMAQADPQGGVGQGGRSWGGRAASGGGQGGRSWGGGAAGGGRGAGGGGAAGTDSGGVVTAAGGGQGGRSWGSGAPGGGAAAAGGGRSWGGGAAGGGGGQMAPEMLKAMRERMFQRFPKMKEEYDKKLKEDPELATDAQKWQAFMAEMRQKGILQFGGGGGGGRSWGGN